MQRPGRQLAAPSARRARTSSRSLFPARRDGVAADTPHTIALDDDVLAALGTRDGSEPNPQVRRRPPRPCGGSRPACDSWHACDSRLTHSSFSTFNPCAPLPPPPHTLLPRNLQVHEFLIAIAVCNTVVPSTDPKTGEIQYQVEGGVSWCLGLWPQPPRTAPPATSDSWRRARVPYPHRCTPVLPPPCPPKASSPDEEALVEGAAFLGYRLTSRTTEAVVVEWGGRAWTYDVLAVLEFNSDRWGAWVGSPWGPSAVQETGALLSPRPRKRKGAARRPREPLSAPQPIPPTGSACP
jgi:hypothetical protein